MKLTVIGGGGVRSMFLAKSIAQKSKELNISNLVLMDIDEEKLNIFGKMAKHIAKIIEPDLDVSLTTDKIFAVKDADYVITTIRVGGDFLRIDDEKAALELNLIGQETTGAAGFSFAMRSIAELQKYCELIKEYASPNVLVFNFTNPAGLVSQALRDMGYNFTYGICDAPSGMLRSFAKLLNANPKDVKGEIYGLNHLSFFSSITVNGKDVTEYLINCDEAYKKTDLRYFDKEMLKKSKTIPNEYLYYFFSGDEALKNILNAKETRAQLIARVNRSMINELKNIDIEKGFDKALAIFEHWYGERENNYMATETGVKRDFLWKFDPYSEDDSGYAGVALNFIQIAKGKDEGDMIICTLNNGAIKELQEDDVVEITCQIKNGKAYPHHFENINKDNIKLIKKVKEYERLGAQAIISKSRSLAIKALFVHPLVGDINKATILADEYIKTNTPYTGEWHD